MTVFRKRSKDFVYKSAKQPLIKEVVNDQKDDNGCVVVTEVVVSHSARDFINKHGICMEEYSIGQQIDANVSLKEIPCSTLLDSDDNLDYPENETAETQLLTQLTVDNNE